MPSSQCRLLCGRSDYVLARKRCASPFRADTLTRPTRGSSWGCKLRTERSFNPQIPEQVKWTSTWANGLERENICHARIHWRGMPSGFSRFMFTSVEPPISRNKHFTSSFSFQQHKRKISPVSERQNTLRKERNKCSENNWPKQKKFPVKGFFRRLFVQQEHVWFQLTIFRFRKDRRNYEDLLSSAPDRWTPENKTEHSFTIGDTSRDAFKKCGISMEATSQAAILIIT